MDYSRRSFLALASAWAGVTLAYSVGCSAKGNSNGASQNAPQNAPARETDLPVPQATEPKAQPAVAINKRGTLIGPGGRKNKQGEMEFFIALVNLDLIERYVSREISPSLIPLGYRGHAVVPHPIERTRAAVFEKWGPGASEVDLSTLKVIRPIETVADRQFYGHGAWSLDGGLLYAVEAQDRTKGVYDGHVIVRDAKTLKIQGTFPTFGKSPHDCHILDQGKTLAITNGGETKAGVGEPASVTFVDIASEKLLERVTVKELMAGHLAITGQWRKGDLAVGSTPHDRPDLGPEGFKKVPGGISIRAGAGKELVRMTSPEDVTSRMLGETLSVSIHEAKGIVGATNPAGNILTFWDMKQGKLLKSFDLALARGIALTLDHKHFVVSYGPETSIVMISADDLSLVESTLLAPTGIAGSHVTTYDL